MAIDQPPPYLIYPARRPGKKWEAWKQHPAWVHHQACLAANRPCVQVRTARTRCTVGLDLTTVHRTLIDRPSSGQGEPHATEAAIGRMLTLGGREVHSGGPSIHVYGLPIVAVDEVVGLLFAIAADPGATRPHFTYGNSDPDDVFDVARYECRAL
jgi:hypothetical protein